MDFNFFKFYTMKKTLLFIITLFSFSQLLAQNLEFSQVITLSDNLNGTTDNGSNPFARGSQFIVPSGKVAKLTFAVASISATQRSPAAGIEINGVLITSANINSPIWLKSGDVINSAAWGGGCCASASGESFLSIIEFSTQ